MLFARFLAENHLLVESDSGESITMGECEDLAREAGEDPHSMAARFAQDSLPQIFRKDDPVLEITLPPETRLTLNKLLDSLPIPAFTADDSLGWTYQYWQAEKKAAVNDSGNKIGADELPAVTQLFTEHYMVLFLFHNTVGAWHAGKVLGSNPTLAATAESEEEMRRAVRLQSEGGYEFKYLRFVREAREGDQDDTPTGPWRPAAGTFEGWPSTAKELRVLDPCCGSGHFLTEGFELLVRLRMDEEGLDLRGAIRGVLADNLHGIEIDPRCTQIAAFNLAMAAWKLVGKPIALPAMHVACSGLAVGSTKEVWAALAGDNERLRKGMDRLYDLFEQAPELGSLINPNAFKGDMFEANFAELQPLMKQALASGEDVENAERAVAAQGMAHAAELLSGKYTLAITNVPYLGRSQQSAQLKNLADEQYVEAKADLATIFVVRLLALLQPDGTLTVVTPQNWWFLSSYRDCRRTLLKSTEWQFAASLGEEAWSNFGMRGPRTVLMSMSRVTPDMHSHFCGIDASTPLGQSIVTRSQKMQVLTGGKQLGPTRNLQMLSQLDQLDNPQQRIVLGRLKSGDLLSGFVRAGEGTSTGDNDRFVRSSWEFGIAGDDWIPYAGGDGKSRPWHGRELLVHWEQGKGDLAGSTGARIQNTHLWSCSGVLLGRIRGITATRFGGSAFDKATVAVIPRNAAHLPALYCFLGSSEYERRIRELDQKVAASTTTMTSVVFDIDRWQKVAAEKYPNGLSEPQSNDPTQWLFHGHPAGMLEAGDARDPNPADLLQVALGRLLGYRWPPEVNTNLRLDALTREWVSRCNDLLPFADEDGIVCLEATKGESSAVSRLRSLLAAALAGNWSVDREREFLAAIAAANSTEKKTVNPARSLEDWLRDDFFTEHCKVFNHRPFVWHLWDGQKHGFHCLVNAHKLTGPDGEGRKTLESITYAYLGDWIDRQKSAVAQAKEGADALLAAALHLQGELHKILDGEPPYDLFVRWKPLHKQAIGWEPDINDGVRLNIRPFMSAQPLSGGKKGAGLLKAKPNIKWAKDRGKEPESIRPRLEFPWFWGCKGDSKLDADRHDWTPERAIGKPFDGNRWNDLHYTNAVKQQARDRREATNDTEVES
ncbi:hypothetical protein Poly30_28210 [Planctomycetes bacterium Poly30]|uniref:site-specific DNA-methyltransferase (adenine-specific) n=2 Tax=Saltatorellus ferox TaxID=2528018 RepID=A0A518ET87_9BACT|nr:hypothetical protein Poly30_28210 [Planctomycetes bacterium Poly30]